MTTTERPGRLTYERLANRLERLHGTISTQFPDPKDAGRALDLQQVIKDALATAQTGIHGAAAISPAQLKQQVKAYIAEIHNRHDERHGNELTTQADTRITRTPSALNATHAQPLAPKSPRSTTRDSSKENAAPTPNHAPRKPSSVKKTPIPNRPSRKPIPTSGATKKRPSRSTRAKPKKQDPNLDLELIKAETSLPPPSPADEEDRRLAATTLLKLAEHTPPSFSLSSSFSFSTPPSGVLAPSAAGWKRSFEHDDEDALAPMARKRRASAEAPAYSDIPVLDGVSVLTAFVAGVEYAVDLLPVSHSEGAHIRAWVRAQVGCCAAGLESSVGSQGSALDGVVAAQAVMAQTGVVTQGVNTPSAAGKRFWDVI